jgi:serine/threonine protein kinase
MNQVTQTAVVHPLVGQTVHQYRVERVLGQGGMGVVYHAQDTKLQRPVALKLLSSELVGDEERRRRFLREARAAARVSHPAIAQVYDVDEYEGATFIAMEWVEGKTVRELIRARELDLLGAIDIAIQVADGLAKAHEMGIIHRDIKPANVMVTRDGHAKILDFGLAKWVAAADTTGQPKPGQPHDLTLTQTQLGQVMGTAAYMSPEQVKGQPVDARSDLFSLGVMLFEMTTAELPFQRPTMMETLHAVAFDDTPSVTAIRQDLPLGLQRVVARCLQKRPEDRYADARGLAHDLRALRRDTESGLLRPADWRERALSAWDRMAHLNRTQWTWVAFSAAVLVSALYLLMANVGAGTFIVFAFTVLLMVRHVRNRPQRMLEQFTRAVAKIPEVRVIAAQEGKITVVVDRAPGQLYGRVNQHLNAANRKLFTGKPLTAMIRDDLTPDEVRQLLTGPGVQYVREDAALTVPQGSPPPR